MVLPNKVEKQTHHILWFDLASGLHKMIVYVLTLYGQSLSMCCITFNLANIDWLEEKRNEYQ